MKKYARVMFFGLIGSLSISYGQNPISPAGVYIADPTARVGADGKMYIYGSLDKVPTSYCSTEHDVLASSDLQHWTLYPHSFASAGKGDEVPYSDAELYAPDMMYRNGVYHLYYCLSEGTEGVATSKSPTGPFKNGRLIEGARGIDPTVFIDDDGQAYYYWGQFSAKGAKMNADMKTIDLSTVHDGIVTEQEHYFHEGSFVFKRNGVYYFVYTDISRQDRATCIGYSTGTSPFGPFTYRGVIIDNAGCDPQSWNNHGSVVEYKGQWYILYHRSTHGSNTMRKACIEPITFRADGSIVETPMTSQGAGKPFPAKSKIDAERACLLWGNVRISLIEGSTDNEELSAIHKGDRADWRYIDFGDGSVKTFKVRVKSQAGGQISIGGERPWQSSIGSVTVPPNSDWTTLTCEVKAPKGVHALWLHFDGPADKDLFEIDWFAFE